MSTTVDDLIREVRALAEQSPDQHYEAPDGALICSYLRSRTDPDHGCLMGQAFERIGVSRHMLAQIEGTGIDEAISILGVGGQGPEAVSKVDWLRTVQRKQDIGLSWSHAVQAADTYFPTVKQ